LWVKVSRSGEGEWIAFQLQNVPTASVSPLRNGEGKRTGEERILTAKSGMFGWGDASEHRVFVYDELGYLQEGFETPTQTIDGATYTELRLPGGWMAAIERG